MTSLGVLFSNAGSKNSIMRPMLLLYLHGSVFKVSELSFLLWVGLVESLVCFGVFWCVLGLVYLTRSLVPRGLILKLPKEKSRGPRTVVNLSPTLRRSGRGCLPAS